MNDAAIHDPSGQRGDRLVGSTAHQPDDFVGSGQASVALESAGHCRKLSIFDAIGPGGPPVSHDRRSVMSQFGGLHADSPRLRKLPSRALDWESLIGNTQLDPEGRRHLPADTTISVP
jgi:hypothetical protein